MKLQLSELDLFRNWDGRSISLLKDNSLIRKYTGGQNIYQEGDVSGYLYIVLSGEIEISRHFEDGSYKVIKISKQNELFGEIGFFDKGERENNATVKEDCELLLISRNHFYSISEKLNYEAWLDLLKYMATKLRNNYSLPSFGPIHHSKAVTYKKLLEISKKYNGNVINMNQVELGNELGISRSTVIRVLHELHELGAIKKASKMVMVNENKLNELIGGAE